MFKQIVLSALTYFAMPLVFANGLFQSVLGDVRSGTAGSSFVATSVNSRIIEGTTVTTGLNSRATIRLDDGHIVVLAENSEFVLNAFRFDRAAPVSNNIVVQLLKGALRSFSGLIGGKNPGQFALRTATATIGIRGTDFSVMLVNPVYVSVSEGVVDLTNAAGSFQAGAGTSAIVNSADTLASSISVTALPPQVAATFQQLNSVVIAAGSAGATGATASATGGGLSAGAIVGMAVAAAAVATVVGGKSAAGVSGTTGTVSAR